MKRKTLDYIFSGGGLAIGAMLIVLGVVLASQASFATSYVKDQLGQQKITFTDAEFLSEEELTWKAGSACLVQNSGKAMETGKQAECYANYYIAMHMDRSANNAGFPGETYATMGGVRRGISAEITAAEEAGDTARVAELEAEYDTATSLRSTFQTGETLRGLLLTTYGFSVFGEKAGTAATVSYVVGGLMLALSAAGFVHAFLTPEEKLVGAPKQTTVPGGHEHAA